MNVVSWESGDTTITDMPACADRLLAKIVQSVNDAICAHRDGDLLCPACSVLVLDLAHRTVGTGTVALTALERRRVWVRIAADQARQVAHLNTDPRVMAGIEAAEGWCDGTVTAEECRAHAYAAHAAADAAHAYAADAAHAYAAYAAAHAAADAADAAHAAFYAAYAYAAHAAADAADAAHAAAAAEPLQRLAPAHRAIDVFEQHTGFKASAPEPVVVARAVEQIARVER
jgi:hypothetical protein